MTRMGFAGHRSRDDSPKPNCIIPLTSRWGHSHSARYTIIPVVPHKAVAEVSKMENL